MSLEDIENEMTKLTLTADISNFFMNSKKIEMLEKVANLKVKRMQLEQAQQSENQETSSDPIKVEFVSARTNDVNERIEKLESEVDDALGGVGHA